MSENIDELREKLSKRADNSDIAHDFVAPPVAELKGLLKPNTTLKPFYPKDANDSPPRGTWQAVDATAYDVSFTL